MIDQQTTAINLGYVMQGVFGAVALLGLILAAVLWADLDALGAAVASCAAVIFCQKFGMSYILEGKSHDRIAATAAWWAALALALLSFALLKGIA